MGLSLGGILPAIGAVIGGPWGAGLGALGGALSQEDTNESNAQLALQQMGFQERMSSTAHQREVSDLIAAGLNPILSATRGASTPSGSMPVMVNPAMTGSQIGLNSAYAAKARQETATEEQRTVIEETAAEQARWMKSNFVKFLENKLARDNYLTEDMQQRLWKILPQEIENIRKQGALLDAQEAYSKILTLMQKLQVPEADAYAKFFASELGKKVPYVREGERAISSAASLLPFRPSTTESTTLSFPGGSTTSTRRR